MFVVRNDLALLTALKKAEKDSQFSNDLTKASERLSRVLNETDIRVLVDSMLKKNDAEMYAATSEFVI